MSTDELPDGWTRIEDSDAQAGQYNPQQPIRYERDAIEVQLQPATNATDTEQDVWRLGVVRDAGDEHETIREAVEGRDTAIGIAREFMDAYNERHVAGEESEDDVIASF